MVAQRLSFLGLAFVVFLDPLSVRLRFSPSDGSTRGYRLATEVTDTDRGGRRSTRKSVADYRFSTAGVGVVTAGLEYAKRGSPGAATPPPLTGVFDELLQPMGFELSPYFQGLLRYPKERIRSGDTWTYRGRTTRPDGEISSQWVYLGPGRHGSCPCARVRLSRRHVFEFIHSGLEVLAVGDGLINSRDGCIETATIEFRAYDATSGKTSSWDRGDDGLFFRVRAKLDRMDQRGTTKGRGVSSR